VFVKIRGGSRSVRGPCAEDKRIQRTEPTLIPAPTLTFPEHAHDVSEGLHPHFAETGNEDVPVGLLPLVEWDTAVLAARRALHQQVEHLQLHRGIIKEGLHRKKKRKKKKKKKKKTTKRRRRR
jgi:hypothetical protein